MGFLDMVFPKFCIGCGFLGVYACMDCEKKLLPGTKDTCLYCKKGSLYGLTHPACKKRTRADGAMYIFRYHSVLKSLIKEIKYGLATEVWSEFSIAIKPQWMYKLLFFKHSQVAWHIQPIPLHIKKERARGFNPAYIIARFFQQFLGYPMTHALGRIKETDPQAQKKDTGERYQNIRHAFAVLNRKEVKGKNIILVDDVLTSGATTMEGAKVLKNAGADRVYILTLAKG